MFINFGKDLFYAVRLKSVTAGFMYQKLKKNTNCKKYQIKI